MFEILAKVKNIIFSKMARLGQGLGKTLGCGPTLGPWVYFCTVWLSGGGGLQIKETSQAKKLVPRPEKRLMTRIPKKQETRPGPRKMACPA